VLNVDCLSCVISLRLILEGRGHDIIEVLHGRVCIPAETAFERHADLLGGGICQLTLFNCNA
jgi:hypothetical protein